jgi:hypothetical protein
MTVLSLCLALALSSSEPPAALDPVDPATTAPATDATSSSTPPVSLPASGDAAPPAVEPAPLDGAALAAVVAVQEALAGRSDGVVDEGAVAAATLRAGALGDARLLPLLLGLSQRPGRARQAALVALRGFLDHEAALARLQQAIAADAPLEDLATALPILLEVAVRDGRPPPVPCPEGFKCPADDVVLEAYVRYLTRSAAAPDGIDVDAIAALAALGDPRLQPLFLRLSASPPGPVRDIAIDALVQLTTTSPAHIDPRVRLRLVQGLGVGEGEGLRVLPAVRALAPTDVDATAAVLEARRRARAPSSWREALEATLRERDPAGLEALLAAELAAANAPRPFDTTNRWVLTMGAGLMGAIGGASASATAADQVSPGSGGFYQWWGGIAGGLSAGALTWFALGDRQVATPGVALGLSGGVLGGFAGALVPTALSVGPDLRGRLDVPALAAGALLGLAGATAAGLATTPSGLDVGEFDLTVLAVNAAVAGALLTFGEGDDPAPLAQAMIGSAVVSAGLAGLASWQLEVQQAAQVHAVVAGVVGGVAGLFAGGAWAAASGREALPVLGGGLLGVTTGIVVGGTLGVFDLAPTWGGLVYEGWASVAGGMVGGGLGLALMDSGRGDDVALPLALTAAGMVAGAVTTTFLPDGLVQEPTDLLLQPLFVGLALWHAGVSAAGVGLGGNEVAATFLIAPALTSAGIVAASRFVSATYGDLALMTSTMAWGAWLSTTGIASVAARNTAMPSWVWILGTALAMDAGAAAGAGLAVSGIDQVGWRVAYVSAISAGTTLVLSLPGSLLAAGSGGQVAVSDVLLASSLLGVGIGFATMPLIDFRVAPDIGLGGGREALTAEAPLQLTPTLWAVAPLPGRVEMPVIVGAVGRW